MTLHPNSAGANAVSYVFYRVFRNVMRWVRWAVLTASTVCLLWTVASAETVSKKTVRDVARTLFLAQAGERVDLSGSDLRGLDLSGLDFKGADLSRANLFGADLTAANLAGADLTGAVLDRTVLVRTDFTKAALQNASILRPSVAPDLRFVAQDLPLFRDADLRGVRITARLGGADFSRADLTGADFAPASERGLGGTPTHGLAHVNFTGAKLVNANMAGLTLTFAKFRNANLRGANLSDADLSRADLRGADLAGANLAGADLTDADLEGATGLSRQDEGPMDR
ncbi:conserved protein of unknown function [Candidatus Filomicrobium marinum]|uniref:Pentapeptide repeat-containing protein n=1 Tax=Candidatus Filomicrobium marinum TaxID=1608628 RepID=A0A0D6JJ23_9HYPH|nr:MULTISPECIES: pentapeptide repeat-containing protein [Filomicrobium]MCV0370864.1 pentapeptide repeat-containing protein [Filomicrobium sp.]CFX32255.1 conserved protein of unknown function [Candidatus Filomicrobium marinum]CPR21979.1 conserved protein of unknown function [Candidatus Filomicrobium marinum]